MGWLDIIYNYVWGVPLLTLLLGIGIYLTIALKGIQLTHLPYALKLVLMPEKGQEGKGDITHFESLMTALAGTLGIGNIAGVATALSIGGQGALFWMWVTALIGMATKYGEALLAVKYRTTDDKGEMCGGPMYFIERGLGWKKLAGSFAFFGSIAAFGGGNMLQANSVADVMDNVFHIDPWISGGVMAVLTALTLLGGIKSIGKVASVLVPVMALFYLGGGCTIICYFYDKIPEAVVSILVSAFSGQAAFGGFMGSTLLVSMQTGISRGLMTSEAGLGTASIAAAAAKTDVPGRQALVSMTGSFLATIVMCTITALLLAVTGVFGAVGENGKVLKGASMTVAAFETMFPHWGSVMIAFALVMFAFTTIIGWAYYGEKCLEYLMGTKLILPYRILFSLIIIPGAVFDLEVVWKISDITNGLMAFPNLIGLVALRGVIVKETQSFLKLLKKETRENVLLKTET